MRRFVAKDGRMMWLLLLSSMAMAQEPDSKALKEVERKFLPPPRFGEEPTVKPFRLNIPQPISMNDIQQSPIIQKALRRKGSIQDLRTTEVQSIYERMIVDVHSQADDHGFFYIVDKKGEISRRVHMQYTEDVRPEIAMYEEPRRYLPVFEHKNISPYDRDLIWRPEFSLSLGRTSSDWTADILNDTQAARSTGYKVGGRWLADFPGKFQVGGSLQFEGAQHNLRFGEATYRNYSIGFVMKTRNVDWGGFPWRVYGEFLTGPIGVLSVSTAGNRKDIPIRTTSTNIGWERPYKNAIGEWAWGISWQRDWPKLREQSNFVAQDSSSSTNDVVALHLTQGFAW